MLNKGLTLSFGAQARGYNREAAEPVTDSV